MSLDLDYLTIAQVSNVYSVEGPASKAAVSCSLK